MAFFTKRYSPAGSAPGTLAKTQSAEGRPLKIRLIDYTADEFEVRSDIQPKECLDYLRREINTCVHIEGHPDERTLRELGASFGIHTLALEGVINSGQRPKV